MNYNSLLVICVGTFSVYNPPPILTSVQQEINVAKALIVSHIKALLAVTASLGFTPNVDLLYFLYYALYPFILSPMCSVTTTRQLDRMLKAVHL